MYRIHFKGRDLSNRVYASNEARTCAMERAEEFRMGCQVYFYNIFHSLGYLYICLFCSRLHFGRGDDGGKKTLENKEKTEEKEARLRENRGRGGHFERKEERRDQKM